MLYDAEYFKRQHYGDKASAIKELYYQFLKWAEVIDGQGRTALDLGTAYGYVPELLQFLGYNAIGLDISTHACQQNVTPIVRGVASNVPVRRESVDLITSFEVIEHLTESCAVQLLKDAWSTLKSNGALLLTTPTRFGSTLFNQNKYHPCVKSPQEWVSVIKSVGFKNVQVLKYVLIPRMFQKYHLLMNTGHVSTNIAICTQR
jgi:SAM-dependent methyltransferase